MKFDLPCTVFLQGTERLYHLDADIVKELRISLIWLRKCHIFILVTKKFFRLLVEESIIQYYSNYRSRSTSYSCPASYQQYSSWYYVNITCTATSYPASSCFWNHDNKVASKSPTMTFTKIKISDDGVYQCECHSGKLVLRNTITINVNCK